jgi:D-3-phosphoglycerate dehydrogenase
VAVLHRNTPGMLSQITDIIGSEGVNVGSVTNKAKGDFAYTLLDLDQGLSADAAAKIGAIEGVVRTRLLA